MLGKVFLFKKYFLLTLFSLMYTISLELTSELIHTIQLTSTLNLLALQRYWFTLHQKEIGISTTLSLGVQSTPIQIILVVLQSCFPHVLFVAVLSLNSSYFHRATSTIN